MAILYPIFALAGLTFFCVLRLGYLRFSAVRRGEIDGRFFRLYKDYEEPEYLRAMSRHVVNLHEAPVLFYAVAVIAYVTETVTTLSIALAWIYVALRYLHSYIHQTSNIVLHRFRVFATSQVVLAALWVVVLVGLLR
ncbi:MAG: MAPEG family protein [Woeseiaceae bacterium]